MRTYSFDNGYGTTYTFEIVDRIPKGYEVWNINGESMGDRLLPLCQLHKGTHSVVQETLKAIYLKNNESRDLVLKAVGRGINAKTELAQRARAILAKYAE